MDFLLKKFVSMFIMPLPLGVALVILGLYFLYRNKLGKAKFTLTLSILWLFLISYSPLVDTLLYDLESKNPTLHHSPKHVKYIYVLGGGHHTDDTRPITSQVVEASVVRVNEGIRHYHQLKEKPTLIVSGHSGLFDPNTGASMQKRLALALGVKQEKLHVEPTPRDTQEEAIAAKKYIGKEPFILVTSASHMKRALNFFKQEGLDPIPAPTNHLGNIKYPNYASFFSANAVKKFHIVWHEYLGLMWQKIKG